MFITKVKIAAAVVLAVGLAGTSTGVLTYHALADGPAAIRKVDRPKPFVKDADKLKKDADAEPEEESTPAFKDRSVNNLKQIGLAFHIYHDNNTSFPAHAIYSKDSKALLSWRVAILPYVDQNELYKDFKLDEPWDSKHNKKLLAKMPEIYARPGTKINNPTKTYYQGFVGKGAAFEGTMGTTLASFTDVGPRGSPNTILVIEAKEPVPWTKPADLTFDPDKELPKLGGIFTDGLGVLLADGAVRFVKKGFNEKKMRAFVIRNSGQAKADFEN